MAGERGGALRLRGLSGCAPIAAPGVFWRSCRVALGNVDHVRHGTLRLELPEALAGARPARRAEFLGGRLCAALALRAAGSDGAVGRAGRVPVWPAGFSGSITHAQGRVLAAACRGGAGIGIDLAPLFSAALAAELGPRLGVPVGLPGRDAARQATLLFAAREALFKALSAGLADIPDFGAAVQLGIAGDRVLLRFRGGAWPVRFRFVAGACIALARAETRLDGEAVPGWPGGSHRGDAGDGTAAA
ncbi:hypothetical protein [Mangrovicoccus algicola]|uniref:4'-phosphopantetheinyl transferase N-terminal domain-containing protein n=1 Tax=Mangrovicoccus algicola TaxID=2771008 RepID=A0A8J6Z2M6_9RHOB|nr:hypothetical protein [Mangrovicoccus algicola]MBE3640583.1 hypothetical protein [Mangrovicoccus algicola]